MLESRPAPVNKSTNVLTSEGLKTTSIAATPIPISSIW
jgi:hypothetical protein